MKTITYSLVLYLIISSCLSLIYSRKVSKKIKTHKEPQTPMIREENFHSFIANFAHSYIVSIQGIASKRPFAKQIIHGKKDHAPEDNKKISELLNTMRHQYDKKVNYHN